MLETLTIRNLATVSALEVDFRPGLNALTGETGAGKSIVLGALQILLGERAEKSIIRKGEISCEITAALRLTAEHGILDGDIQAILKDSGAPRCEENQLILRRIVSAGGSRAYVNACPVTLSVMRRLGELLVDIHGPNDHQSLLNPRCQLRLLDAFGNLTPRTAECRARHETVEACRRELAVLQQEHMSPAEAELLNHQLGELDAAALDPDEETQLTARHRAASHARRLLEIANQCRLGLTEGDGCISDQLGAYVRLLGEARQLATEGEDFETRLENIVDEIQELCRDIDGFADALELDQKEMMRIEERLDLIQRLRRKHGGSVAEVLAKADAMRTRLAAVEHRHERIADCERTCHQAQAELAQCCQQLSSARAETAVVLAGGIEDKLQRLGFARSTFRILLAEHEPGPNGQDRVEFCFAPNPGEDVMPLRKIASSGEISRVMLAVKTVLTEADQVPILVFDEVDANIGGRVAAAVAQELAAVGQRHQVLCITHLPQIAAAADTHYNVGKRVEAGRTLTELAVLDRAGRIQELSRMMGAAADSDIAREHAEELLRDCGTPPRHARQTETMRVEL